MEDQKQQIVEKLNAANNVLVTVPANPSVDQLAACIGLTLLLNKMGKHGTAVFSGKVPSTIKFLKPEETIEKTTDSLRDFIIAIDKSKADKLRYKVEDEVVKIFITPYKSAIGEKDLVFSQGDFNVDVVMALGVSRQQDVDAAITAHGRILHDAVVISVTNTQAGDLGTLNWVETAASGVSELVSRLSLDLGKDLLDKQISTALLTGIVAETDHFGNAKTTPQTMTISASLLAAGANQQLVASELGHTDAPAAHLPGNQQASAGQGNVQAQKRDNGDLGIAHSGNDRPNNDRSGNSPNRSTDDRQKKNHSPQPPAALFAPDGQAAPAASSVEPDLSFEDLLQQPDQNTSAPNNQSTAPQTGQSSSAEASQKQSAEQVAAPAAEAPANPPEAQQNAATPDNTIELPQPSGEPLDHFPDIVPLPAPESDPLAAATPAIPAVNSNETLEQIEQEVNSPHLQDALPDDSDVDAARKAVEDALKTSDVPEGPRADLNAMEVNLDLGHESPPPAPATVMNAESLPAEIPEGTNLPPQPDYMPSALPPQFGMPPATQMTAPDSNGAALNTAASQLSGYPAAIDPMNQPMPPADPIQNQPDTQQYAAAPLTAPDQPYGPPPTGQSAPAPQAADDNLPSYLQTPSMMTHTGSGMPILQPLHDLHQPQPSILDMPANQAANEPAPLASSPADQPFTMPLPPASGAAPQFGGTPTGMQSQSFGQPQMSPQIPSYMPQAASAMPPAMPGFPQQGPPPPGPPPIAPLGFGQ